jgi:hypothetical protein
MDLQNGENVMSLSKFRGNQASKSQATTKRELLSKRSWQTSERMVTNSEETHGGEQVTQQNPRRETRHKD